MHDTVLVPVDGSESASVALRHALDIVGPEATVHVLAVVEPTGNPLGFGVEEIESIDDAVTELAETIIAGGGTDAVTLDTEVRRGEPAYEVILAYADEIEADLLVLGRGGTSILPDAVFGSTADRVARLSDVPVVLVPAAKEP